MQASLGINVIKDLRVNVGASESESENATVWTRTRRLNWSFAFRKTTFTANLSPTVENYSITRELNINKLGIGNTASLGINYQRFIGGHGVTGNIAYSW